MVSDALDVPVEIVIYEPDVTGGEPEELFRLTLDQ